MGLEREAVKKARTLPQESDDEDLEQDFDDTSGMTDYD